jgi:hypothetical protein
MIGSSSPRQPTARTGSAIATSQLVHLAAICRSWRARERFSCDDWHDQRRWEQRWAYLFHAGLISETAANAWREDVWPSEPVEEEKDDVA